MIQLVISAIVALLAACQAPEHAASSAPAAASAPNPPASTRTVVRTPGDARLARTVAVSTTTADDEEDETPTADDDQMIEVEGVDLEDLEGINEEVAAAMEEAMKAHGEARKALIEAQKAFPGMSRFRWAASGEGIEIQKNAPYIGVSTDPVKPPLSAQLAVTPGTGLMVTMLETDSPAAKAGLQKLDVLAKLDDQMLVNSEQFAVLVRAKKPGETVKITYLRGGKENTASITLGSKDLPKLGPGGMRADWGFSPDSDLFVLEPGKLAMGTTTPGTVTVQGLNGASAPVIVRGSAPAQAPKAPRAAEQKSSRSDSVQMNYSTDDVQIFYSLNKGKVKMQVRDVRDNTTVFDDAREPTKEELAAMKPEVRTQVQRMLNDVKSGALKQRAPSAPAAPLPPVPPVPPMAPTPPTASADGGNADA